MSIFGRRNKRGPRTAEDRERARREREARRAAREGRPAPVWDDDPLRSETRLDWADEVLDGVPGPTPAAEPPHPGAADRSWDAEQLDPGAPTGTPDAVLGRGDAWAAGGDPAVTPDASPVDATGPAGPDAASADATQPYPIDAGEVDTTRAFPARPGEGDVDATRPYRIDARGDQTPRETGSTAHRRDAGADPNDVEREATQSGRLAAGGDDATRPYQLDAAGDDGTRVWNDGLGEWVELPSEPPVERPSQARGGQPAHADADPRPAWDRTDAWELPAENGLDVWEAPSGDARDAPRPTLGEELRAVKRGERGGWADAERSHDDVMQQTVEWDVLHDRPKQRPVPPPGPAGGDDPTIEWDVLADRPRGQIADPEPTAPRAHAGGGGSGDGRDGSDGSDDFTGAAGGAASGGGPGGAASGGGPGGAASADARRGRSRRAGRASGGDGGAPKPAGARGGGRAGGRRPRAAAAARRSTRSRTLPPPPPRPGQRPPRSRRPRTGALVAACALVALVLVAYGLNAVFQPFKGDGGTPVRVTIPADSTLGEVGDVLERAGVVDSGFLFTLRARLAGASVQAGNYTLRADMAYGAAIDALEGGPEAEETIRITIPEGRARREARDLVVKAGLKGSYLEATKRADGFDPRRYGAPRRVASLEGFLFPATYELKAGATSKDLVAQQLAAFRENIAKVDMRRARARNLTTYDVLIIASMVEREATLPRERRLIAAVIHNRLRQGMPLGIDATIRYATRNWTRPLRQSELNIDSAYNTRLRTGLPPTPIGSPGLASIRAAANPAKVDYLYYVVKPNGNGAHNFSSTIEEFERDVAAYNRERERRGGRSPANAER